jgi:hypothetical protein
MAVAMVPTASALLVPFDHLPISSPAFFTDTCPLLRPFATILNPRCQNPIAMSSDESHDCTHLQINEHDVAIWPQGGRGVGVSHLSRSLARFSARGMRMVPYFPATSHASFVFSHKRADEMLRARYAEIARDHPARTTSLG